MTQQSRRRQGGFTLIELMIILAIMGIIAAIALPNFIGVQDKAKPASVRANMRTTQISSESFATDMSAPPVEASPTSPPTPTATPTTQNRISRSTDSGPMLGTRLAGTEVPLYEFTKDNYDRAVASGNLVVLYFYNKDCWYCHREEPELRAAFDRLMGSGIVGFRANYGDDDTDADERALARELGVLYQHTKVFVKNGKKVLSSPETWTKDRYLTEIEKARSTP